MRHRGPRHFSALLTRRRPDPQRRLDADTASDRPRRSWLPTRPGTRLVAALGATVLMLGGAVVAAGIVDDEGATAAYQPPPRSVSPTTSRSHTRTPMPSAQPATDGVPSPPATRNDTATPEREPQPAPTPRQTQDQAPAQDDATRPSLLPVPTSELPSADTSPQVSAAAPGVGLTAPRSSGERSTGGAGPRPRDSSAPQTAIDSRPAGHDDSQARFTFHASESASFACSLDGAGFRSCDSGVRYDGLEPGWHTFAVRATDSAGNTDPSPDSYGWHTSASGWAQDQAKDLLN